MTPMAPRVLRIAAALLLALSLGPRQAASTETAEAPDKAIPALTAEAVVERYLAARGGVERWRATESLKMTGIYAAFSEQSPFVLLRRKGDLFRLEYELNDIPAIRARDGKGPWMQHSFLTPEPRRVTEEPYKTQLERESWFGLELLDWKDKGLKIKLLGAGEIDGIATLDLEVTLPDGSLETWHLDPETYLEFAVDSEVNDFTQGSQRMTQRIFFDDFRTVDGLVLPHSLETEFWARLETMRIDSVEVNGEIAEDRFRAPPEADAPAENGD